MPVISTTNHISNLAYLKHIVNTTYQPAGSIDKFAYTTYSDLFKTK